MRRLLFLLLLLQPALFIAAQESNPLINSGEIIKQASVLHDDGKYKEAIELYKKVRRGDTNYYKVMYEMAFSQMLDSQFVEARKTCEAGLLEISENSPELYTLYGSLLDDMGEPERALRIYDSALKIFPNYSEIFLNKGVTLIKLEKIKEAEEVFQQGLIQNPYQASSHMRLAQVAYEQGKIVQAFLGYVNYLLLQPGGRHQKTCINALSSISNARDEVKAVIQKRTEEGSENFLSVEKILLSKIALDKQYKPLLKLDDPISRQIQVVFEKLQYESSDPDFWMQYYVPLFRKIFDEKKFEPFVYRLFSEIKIDAIQDYLKKNKDEIQDIVNTTVSYCDKIRTTRELNYEQRKNMDIIYQFSEGRLFGKGKSINKGEQLVGDWEFYFSPGNLRSKGKYNEKGERTGTWAYYHFNGQLSGTQPITDGKLNGEEKFYYKNGMPSSVATYKDGNEENETKSYFWTGTPRTFTHYKNGKLNGEKKIFNSTGALLTIENYKDDSLHGVFKNFYASGDLKSEGTYDNGKITGVYKSYFDNGKVSSEGKYVNGKAEGEWKEYHQNGKIKVQQMQVNGVAEGEYAEYHQNGQLYYKCKYVNGKFSGDIDYFDDDGKKYLTYTFDDDILKKVRYYDKQGNEKGVMERKARKLDLTAYSPEGFKVSQAIYNDKGQIQGKQTYYYRSGKISSETNYEDGVQQGEAIYYHPNGKKQLSSYYEDDEKHGYEKNWFQNGTLQEEGWYQYGQLQGTWITYNELGDLLYKTDFLDGELNGYKEEYLPNGKKDIETKYNNGWTEELIQFDTMGNILQRNVFKNSSGPVKTLHYNGKLNGEGSYKSGSLEGVYKFYYFDGKLNAVQYYKQGELDSIYRNYFRNDKLYVEGQYRFGKKTGTWKRYFESGKLNSTETYVDGELSGKRIYYYENGKVDSEIDYENGNRNGWTKKYDKEGNLLYHIHYADDSPIGYTYQDKTGKLVPEIPLPGNTGKVKTFYSNGNPSSEFEYIDGKLIGDNIFWYANGKLWSKNVEDYSQSNGIYKSYYENGQLEGEYNYANDNLHGPYKEYNEKGILTEEGVYYNGDAHGIQKSYDDTGKLKEIRIFYYGKLLDVKK